jgi:protein-S-isoprenylcysteine O-methyltransferase Ste14
MHPGFAFAVSPLWRTLFWLSFAAWIAIELAIWSRDRAKVKGRRDDKFSMLAIGISIGIANSLAFNAPQRWPAWTIQAPPEALTAAGIVLIWAGIAFRLWAVRTLGRFFRVTVTVQEDHRLVDTGPYVRLRNPSYTGALITMTGVGVALGNWLSLAAMVLIPILGFGWRIRVEEASLAARFGADYDAYRRRRWALVPPLW